MTTVLLAAALTVIPLTGPMQSEVARAWKAMDSIDRSQPDAERTAWEGLLKALALDVLVRTGAVQRLADASKLDEAFEDALAYSGVQPLWPDGLSRFSAEGFATVEGSAAQFVGLFRFSRTQKEGFRFCLAKLDFSNRLPTARALEGDYLLPLLPRSALLSESGLLVVGESEPYGNSPRAVAASFLEKEGRWVSQGSASSQFELVQMDSLSLDISKRSVRPIKVLTRTAPRYLPYCRATANFSHVEEWTFERGIPKVAWKHPRNTAYNRLDRLYGAYLENRSFRSLCANTEVAKAIRALEPVPDAGLDDVWFAAREGALDASEIGIRSLRTKFHFVQKDGQWLVDRITPLAGQVDAPAH